MRLEGLENATPQDFWQHVFNSRPSTKWLPKFITNVSLYLYHMNYAMGGGNELPSYIKSNSCIIALDRRGTGKRELYTDMLCAFRCLVVYNNTKAGKSHKFKLESQTKQLSRPYPEWCHGVSVADLPRFESEFSIDIDVYSLTPNQSVIPRYLSKNKYGNKLVLNLSPDNHLSYVNDVETYLSRYMCPMCSRMFYRLHNQTRHSKTCKKNQRYKFPGGSYRLPINLFQKLDRVGIHVPQSRRHYKWFATFDCESILSSNDTGTTSADTHTEYMNTHVPVSISVASNVDGFREAVLICEENPQTLADKFIEHLSTINHKASQLARQCWSDVIEQLKRKINDVSTDAEIKTQYQSLMNEFENYIR